MTPERATRETREATDVRSLMPQVLERLRHAARAAVVCDYPTWKRVVGPRHARQSQPVGVRDGQLIVHARNASIVYELSAQTPRLLGALGEVAPDRQIRHVRVQVGEVAW